MQKLILVSATFYFKIKSCRNQIRKKVGGTNGPPYRTELKKSRFLRVGKMAKAYACAVKRSNDSHACSHAADQMASKQHRDSSGRIRLVIGGLSTLNTHSTVKQVRVRSVYIPLFPFSIISGKWKWKTNNHFSFFIFNRKMKNEKLVFIFHFPFSIENGKWNMNIHFPFFIFHWHTETWDTILHSIFN